jgi:antitoxin YefM
MEPPGSSARGFILPCRTADGATDPAVVEYGFRGFNIVGCSRHRSNSSKRRRRNTNASKSHATAAVLIGADDYDGLVETIAILSDSDAIAEIRAGIEDFEASHTETADDEVQAKMVRAGGLAE